MIYICYCLFGCYLMCSCITSRVLANWYYDYKLMLINVLFVGYMIMLMLLVVLGGLNYYRIKARSKCHPDIVVSLVPFLVNFLLAKTVFISVHPLWTTLLPCLGIYFVVKRLKGIRVFGLTGGIATGKSTLCRCM